MLLLKVAPGKLWLKLFKTALRQVIGRGHREPPLIKLQTYASDAVRIVNDRPLTTLRDQPNDLLVITPSCFLGQKLASSTPVGTFHKKGDLRRDYMYNSTLAHQFWLIWIKGYLTSLQDRKKWRAVKENLYPGQLVLVGDAEDIAKRGLYRLGRIHCLHPRLGRVKKLCDLPWQCWQITRVVKQERSNISSEMFLKLPRFNCSCLLFMKYRVGQKNVTTFYILTIFKITKTFVSYSCSLEKAGSQYE